MDLESAGRNRTCDNEFYKLQWTTHTNQVVIPTICVFGLILNVIATLVLKKLLSINDAYLYMMALSVTDAINLFFHMPSGMAVCSKEVFSYCKNDIYVQMRRFSMLYQSQFLLYVSNSCEMAGVWLTVLVSLERYITMRKNRQKTSSNSGRNNSPGNGLCKKRALFYVILVWVVSLGFNLPRLFSTKWEKLGKNDKVSVKTTEFGASNFFRYYQITHSIFMIIIPLIFLSIINLALIHFVRTAAQRREKVLQIHDEDKKESKLGVSSTQKLRAAQQKLTILLILVVSTLLVGQVPHSLTYSSIYPYLDPNHCSDISKDPLYQKLRLIMQINLLISYSYNFFLYLGLNKHFKDQLLTMFRVKDWAHKRGSMFNFYCCGADINLPKRTSASQENGDTVNHAQTSSTSLLLNKVKQTHCKLPRT
ncbi:hypothetical protein Ciccas_009967 [Cichlidogyrus casuarinus]|uniref:G-protein coupled receptors family 1 profile domain-containing protein n=1 Tax=Cichlidogyrus casuarinus TaxID=1844966 RepID=A0ABD2PX18_9PLAT